MVCYHITRSNVETMLPDLARFITEQWRMHAREGEWIDMRAWLSGVSAALYFVSNEAFEDIIQELDFLEQICTTQHRARHDQAPARSDYAVASLAD